MSIFGIIDDRLARRMTDSHAIEARNMTATPGLLGYTTYTIATGDIEAFRSLAMRMATAAKARDGCIFLDVAQDAGDSAIFRLVEGWRDQAALDAHGTSAEFQAVIGEAAALGIVDRSIEIYSVFGKKTLSLA